MGDINSVAFSGIVAFKPRLNEFDAGSGRVIFYLRSEKVFAEGHRAGSIHTTMMRCEYFFRGDVHDARRVEEGVYCTVAGHLRNMRWTDDDGGVHRNIVIECRELKVLLRPHMDDVVEKGPVTPSGWFGE